MSHYIIPITCLLLPILISCCIALFVPVSPRLKWMGSLRNTLIYILITIGLIFILITIRGVVTYKPVECFCRARVPLLPTLIYFLLWFSFLSAACRHAKFKCFKNRRTFVATIIISTIITIGPAIIYNIGKGCACSSVMSISLILLIYLTLITILHVIYKKALGKQAKK